MSTTDEKPSTEQALATAAHLLLRRGHVSEADLMSMVLTTRWKWVSSDWGDNYFDVWLVVPYELRDTFDKPDILHLMKRALDDAGRGYGEFVSDLYVSPAPVESTDWRTRIASEVRSDEVSNQATLAPLPVTHPRLDGLSFRDVAEVAVYLELKRLQQELPEEATITIVPNCATRVPGRTWEPDFLITYKGRAGIIEVDGATHNHRRDSDKSRERIFENGGISYIERFTAADCQDADQVKRLVGRFLHRLVQDV